MTTTNATTALGLIIHDMQNDHVNNVEETEKSTLIANHVRLVEAARSRRLPVFYTGHWLRPDHFDAAIRAPSRNSGTLVAGTNGPDIIDELQPVVGDYVIRKGGGMSSFGGTMLDLLLRRLRVTKIIVAGVSTPVGVESTIRSAVDLDYDCLVVSDACRSRRVENHEASLLNIATSFGDVATTLATIDLMQGVHQTTRQ